MACGMSGPTGVPVPRPVQMEQCSALGSVTGPRMGVWSVRASGVRQETASSESVLWMANGSSGALGLVVPKHVVEEASKDRECVLVPFLGGSHAQGTERKLDVAMRRDVQVRQTHVVKTHGIGSLV